MELERWASPQMLRRFGASARSARARRTTAPSRQGDLKLFELIAIRLLITLRDREER